MAIKKIIIGGLAAAALALTTAGTAGAITAGSTTPAFSGPAGDHDSGAFWVDVHPELNGSEWTMAKDTQLAVLICRQLEGGVSEGHLVADVANSDGTPTSQSGLNGITYVVHAAEWHFCPSEY